MTKNLLLLCLLALPAPAEPPPKTESSILVTVRGSLTALGKPVTAAQFYLAPAESHTAVELDKAGKFEVKAVASRSYTVDIVATGYAPVRRAVELDAKGTGDLGAVQLEPLKTARASVVIAPRGSLKGVPAQRIELRHGSCANVRAQDDSGCRLEFCVSQDGPDLQVSRYTQSGQMRTLGKVSLADAIGGLPKGGTFVVGQDQQTVPLAAGETLVAEPGDPYCAALLHVDELK
jgi:hypothetical protein